MTNKEFCARLRKAKKLAVRDYPYAGCIYTACRAVGIHFEINSTFGNRRSWNKQPVSWVYSRANSKDDIARVFDESIRALGEEP